MTAVERNAASEMREVIDAHTSDGPYVPRMAAEEIVEKLAEHGLTQETDSAFRRIAIEKPFGTDLASAKALNARILSAIARGGRSGGASAEGPRC